MAFDFIAASSESVCNILPVDGIYLVLTLKEWFLIDAYTWMIGLGLVVMMVYFPKGSNISVMSLILGTLIHTSNILKQSNEFHFHHYHFIFILLSRMVRGREAQMCS